MSQLWGIFCLDGSSGRSGAGSIRLGGALLYSQPKDLWVLPFPGGAVVGIDIVCLRDPTVTEEG